MSHKKIKNDKKIKNFTVLVSFNSFSCYSLSSLVPFSSFHHTLVAAAPSPSQVFVVTISVHRISLLNHRVCRHDFCSWYLPSFVGPLFSLTAANNLCCRRSLSRCYNSNEIKNFKSFIVCCFYLTPLNYHSNSTH